VLLLYIKLRVHLAAGRAVHCLRPLISPHRATDAAVSTGARRAPGRTGPDAGSSMRYACVNNLTCGKETFSVQILTEHTKLQHKLSEHVVVFIYM
jgi:hypothetical protein